MRSPAFSAKAWLAPAVCVAIVGGLVACGDTALLPPEAGMGSNPTLPQPKKTDPHREHRARQRLARRHACPRPWPAWA
jgi:hypothetical protein